MDEIRKIADQIRLTYIDGFWGGGSIKELFYSFDVIEASSYPIPRAHSVWEIALHISAWHDIFRNRIINSKTEYHYENDWPHPASPTTQNWSDTLKALNKSIENLVNSVLNFKEDELYILVPGKSFSFYEMLHGIQQHDQYHAGQVMFLKKAIQNKQ